MIEIESPMMTDAELAQASRLESMLHEIFDGFADVVVKSAVEGPYSMCGVSARKIGTDGGLALEVLHCRKLLRFSYSPMIQDRGMVGTVTVHSVPQHEPAEKYRFLGQFSYSPDGFTSDFQHRGKDFTLRGNHAAMAIVNHFVGAALRVGFGHE